ncbi:MAG TPA: hypothetical protein VLZ78_09425 [Terrimesophilobacter sp.]|nr:hypothetical protein [Terrimesophilobacter sp.]
MRSERPIPGNPWPHDMVIGIDEPNNICQLLFIRNAWGIAKDVEIPMLDPLPDVGSSAMPSSASESEWSARWKQAWSRAWRWYAIAESAQRVTSELLRRLSTPGQPLHPAFPPFWQAEHGDEGVDSEAFEKWQRASRPEMFVALESTPERVCLDALIAAWNAGLETVVTLPYAGYFAQRISAKHLVVSGSTRAHPESYNRALASPVIADWKP